MNHTQMLPSKHLSKTIPLITKREIEVLHLVAQGLSTQDIAKQLYISEETVKSHRKNLNHKMDACNGASLVRAAYDVGILQLNLKCQ